MMTKVSGGYSRTRYKFDWRRKFNYILTIIDHFSKYAWVYPLVSKHGELIRDKLSSIFIIGHFNILHTDNR